MVRVIRRPLAELDILEIWDFIAEDSVTEADLWIDKLDEKLLLWATQPMMGRSRDELAKPFWAESVCAKAAGCTQSATNPHINKPVFFMGIASYCFVSSTKANVGKRTCVYKGA